MKITYKKRSIFLLLGISIAIIGMMLLNSNLLKINAEDIKEPQMTEVTEIIETSSLTEESSVGEEIQATSKGNLRGIEGKEMAIAANGVKVPLDAQLSDFATIEDFPFDALDETPTLLEDEGFERQTINAPVAFPSKLKDGRTYYMAFGAVSNNRKITDETPGYMEAPETIRDHYNQALPAVNMPTSEIINVESKNSAYNAPGIPLFGPQIAIKPKAIDARVTWATYAHNMGRGMGARDTNYMIALEDQVKAVGINGEFTPQILKMYVKGSTVYAYGVSFDTTKPDKPIDGYVRVEMTPVNEKGRIKTTVKYLSATSATRKAAIALGIHINIQGSHQESKLYSLGNDTGLYFHQLSLKSPILNNPEWAYGDKQPYLIRFHRDGYKGQADAQVVSGKYHESAWQKLNSKFDIPSSRDPGPFKIYPDNMISASNGERHPVAAFRWNSVDLAQGEAVDWVMDQSVTSANAKAPAVDKKAKNITTNNIADTNVGDTIEYAVELDAASRLEDINIADTLPPEVEAPTEIVFESTPKDEEKVTEALEISEVYNPDTHTITVDKAEMTEGIYVLKYKVKITKAADGITITNTAKVNGVDLDGDALDEIEVSYDLPVKEIPYGDAVVKYVDEKDKEIAKTENLTDLIGTPIISEKKEIPGYIWEKTTGPVTGNYEKEVSNITYIYKEGRYTLKQDVFNSDDVTVDGTTVKNNQELTYKVTLESLFKPVTPGVSTYKTLVLTENVGEHLEKIEEITFLQTDGTVAGTGVYDPVKKEVKATLTNLTIDRSENLILTFKATVKKDVLAETKIKVKASAEASYSDDMTAKEVTSNEVISTVLGGLTLVSAPDGVNFGSVKISDYQKEVAVDKNDMQTPLLVQDTRIKRTNWDVTAHIISDMTNGSDVRTGALKYYHNKKPLTLNNLPQPIYDNDGKNTTFEFNISDLWGKVAEAEGLKLDMSGGDSPSATNSYNGTIQWTVRDVIE